MSGTPVRLEPAPGRALRDLLFDAGVEFPCGGLSGCGNCKVRVVSGNVPVTPAMTDVLSPGELAAGWRLGCLADAAGPVTVLVEQWSAPAPEDTAAVPFEPAAGLGVAVDVGTTTLAAQLIDRRTGAVLAVQSALNPQGRHGADLMSRLHYELHNPGELTSLIRKGIGALLTGLTGGHPLAEVLLVGNTAMHHLFCGLDVGPLTAAPFRSPQLRERRFTAGELGWQLPLTGTACFLPCVGGFVGSDVLAGVVATGLHHQPGIAALLDLGTNGEIAVGGRDGVRCASTAAGPAFEGGRIGQGMRAGAGAVDRVALRDGQPDCHVLGGGPARGVCGSGLVDAVAVALELGWLGGNGRLTGGRRSIPLAGAIRLTQADVRELQLAKGALAAGLELLLAGRSPELVYLAGAFGNYVQPASARRLGLFPAASVDPTPAGNTALRGARRLLLAGRQREAILAEVLGRLEHVELAAHPDFSDRFVAAMAFPEGQTRGGAVNSGSAVP